LIDPTNGSHLVLLQEEEVQIGERKEDRERGREREEERERAAQREGARDGDREQVLSTNKKERGSELKEREERREREAQREREGEREREGGSESEQNLFCLLKDLNKSLLSWCLSIK